MNKEDKIKLKDELVALFLYALNYSNSKEFKKLLSTYKSKRDIIKGEVNKIYAKYSKNNSLNTTHLNREITNIESKLKVIALDLLKEEDELLKSSLSIIYMDTYNSAIKVINKYIENNSNVSLLKAVDAKINNKVAGKNCFDRNKINKEKLISKVSNDIKSNLKTGQSIDVLNKIIDKDFGTGAFMSKRLLENEIAINFNNSLMKAYGDSNIKKVIFNSTLEENTCGICENLNGSIFEIDNAIILPLHVSCKCWYEPVI